MKKSLYSFTVAVALATIAPASLALAAAPSSAPPQGVNANGDATSGLTIAGPDATRLKTWIVDQKTASVPAPTGFTATVGSVVPMTITLKPIAVTPAITGVDPMKLQYAMIGDKI